MFRYICACSFVVFASAVLAPGFVYVQGPVPLDCLKCICDVESNCMLPNPYRISYAYWTDAKRSGRPLGEDWTNCTESFTCSAHAVQGYMEVWAQKGCDPPTCMDFARIHNGGPNGCRKLSTLPYWREVYKCLYDTSQ